MDLSAECAHYLHENMMCMSEAFFAMTGSRSDEPINSERFRREHPHLESIIHDFYSRIATYLGNLKRNAPTEQQNGVISQADQPEVSLRGIEDQVLSTHGPIDRIPANSPIELSNADAGNTRSTPIAPLDDKMVQDTSTAANDIPAATAASYGEIGSRRGLDHVEIVNPVHGLGRRTESSTSMHKQVQANGGGSAYMDQEGLPSRRLLNDNPGLDPRCGREPGAGQGERPTHLAQAIIQEYRPCIANSPPSDPIPYDCRDGIITLRPASMDQCKDFPALLDRAKQLGADKVGVFKYALPQDLGKQCRISHKKYNQVSTFMNHPEEHGVFKIDRVEGKGFIRMEYTPVDDIPADVRTRQFEDLLCRRSGLGGIRYRTDLKARSSDERKNIGLPQESPIWHTKGNQLDRTKFSIPGLHWPFAYISHNCFGAPFVCHKEDCDLLSANVLYFGEKIWTVTAPENTPLLERKFKAIKSHEYPCAQALRHSSIYLRRSMLTSWGILHKVFSQVANEVVVVFPNAYHQGFSTGSTLAEAINYAPHDWTIQGYSECHPTCPGFPIPNAKLEFRAGNEIQVEEEPDEGSKEPEEGSEGPDKGNLDNLEQDMENQPRTLRGKAGVKTPGTYPELRLKDKAKERRDSGVMANESGSKRLQTVEHPDQSFQKHKSTITEEGAVANKSYWEDWDKNRQTEQGSCQTIRATKVLERLSSTPSVIAETNQARQKTYPLHCDIIVTMVMAVANAHVFQALKRVIIFLQQNQQTWTFEILSADPKILVRAIDAIETSSDLNCYLRRFALARLAKLYLDTCANGGALLFEHDTTSSTRSTVTKAHKAEAYKSLIQHIWGVPFPTREKKTKMDKNGLIDADTADALRWNKHKNKLLKQIEAGRRWLGWVERFGWSSMSLVTRNWSISENKVAITDTAFENTLTNLEYTTLLVEIDFAKGRFLRHLNKELGGNLFEFLNKSSGADSLPLLELDDQEIMVRPDCDLQWIQALALKGA